MRWMVLVAALVAVVPVSAQTQRPAPGVAAPVALQAAEGAVAVLEPSGAGGVLYDDTNSSLGWYVYRPERKQATSEEVIASGLAAIFGQWMKPVEDLGMTTTTERNTDGTNNSPFQQAGLPGFLVFSGSKGLR